jgi:hypothetical protein
MQDHDERRSNIRMSLDCKMTYKYPDSDQEFKGTCKNLSGSGVMFTTLEDIEIGIALEIKITPAKTITPPMHAYVEIIRSQYIEDDSTYHVAAEIKGIKDG